MKQKRTTQGNGFVNFQLSDLNAGRHAYLAQPAYEWAFSKFFRLNPNISAARRLTFQLVHANKPMEITMAAMRKKHKMKKAAKK